MTKMNEGLSFVHLRSLCHLGKEGLPIEHVLFRLALPGTEIDDPVRALLQRHFGSLVPLARKHRVYHRLVQLAHRVGCDGGAWVEIQRKRALVERELQELLRWLHSCSIRFLLLKGAAIEPLYGHAYLRQRNDTDLLVETFDDYAAIVKFLEKKGYTFEYFPMFGQRQGRIVGVHKLAMKAADGICSFEVNIGGIQLGPLKWIEMSTLLQCARETSVNGIPVLVPSYTDMCCIAVGEAGTNERYRIRDIIDLLVLENLPDVDREELARKLTMYGLMQDYKALKRWHRQLLRRELQPDELENVDTRRSVQGLRDRFARTYPFLRRQGLSAPASLFRTLAYLARTFNESCVRSDRLLRLVKLSERIMGAEWFYDHGFLVHFIQLDGGSPGTWEARRDRERLYVRTPLGCYMASAYCLHEPDEIEEANRQAAALWGEAT